MAGFLIVQRGNDIGARFTITKGLTTVGRDSENDIVLDDPYVSRYHAVFKEVSSKGDQPGGLSIIDLGSENPVLIKETPLDAGEVHILQHREIIRIGQTVFSYQTANAPKPTAPAAVTPAPTAFAVQDAPPSAPASPPSYAPAPSYTPPSDAPAPSVYAPYTPSPAPAYSPPPEQPINSAPAYSPPSYTPTSTSDDSVPDLDDMETGEIPMQSFAKEEGVSGNSGSYGAFGSGEVSRNADPHFLPQTPLPQVSSQEFDRAVPTVKTSDAPKEFIESAPNMDDNPTRLNTPVVDDAPKKKLDPMSPDYQDFGEAKTVFFPAIRPRPNTNDQ